MRHCFYSTLRIIIPNMMRALMADALGDNNYMMVGGETDKHTI
jgi:hypothetical protein